MTYRDDREALHAKSEALQQELDETRRELDQLRALNERGSDEGAEPECLYACASAAERRDHQRGALARMMLGSALLATGLVGALAVRHHAGPYAYHRSMGAAGMCPRMFYEAVHTTGHVTQAANASVPVGAACTVDVSPVPMRRFNCRVEVRCGGTALYGAPGAGYTQCEIAGGRPQRAVDRWSTSVEGDPEMKLDLTEGRVIVSDEGNHSFATIVLDR